MNLELGEKFGRAVQFYMPECVSFSGLIGLSILDIFSIPNPVFFWIGAVTIFLGTILGARRNLTSTSVTSDNHALRKIIGDGNRNFYDVWDDRTRRIYQDLCLSDRHRLSIYRFDEEIEMFRLLGRFSTNGTLSIRHRITFPADQGVIGQAWQTGECYDGKIPNPDASLDRYAQYNEKKYNISPATTTQLTMKARCLWALAFTDENEIRRGVLVVESIKREDLDINELKTTILQTHCNEIRLLLTSMKFMEPSLKSAQELGF